MCVSNHINRCFSTVDGISIVFVGNFFQFHIVGLFSSYQFYAISVKAVSIKLFISLQSETIYAFRP